MGSARTGYPSLGRAHHEGELTANVVIAVQVVSVGLGRKVAEAKGKVEPDRNFGSLSVGI